MRLTTSIAIEEWRDKFRKTGIKAGQIEGIANNKPAILCQCIPFPYGAEDEEGNEPVFVQVDFEKPLNQVYPDWDDECEAVTEGIIAEDAETYEGADEERLKETCMYGSWVTEIRSEEIVEITKHIGWDKMP